MYLGYNTNGFAHHRLDDAIAILADLGYQGVGITVDHHVLNPFAEDLTTQTGLVREQLQRTGLRCVIETGARFLLDPWRKHQPTLLSPDEAGRQKRIDFLFRCIDLAEELSADAVSFWSGAVDEAGGWGLEAGGRQTVPLPDSLLSLSPDPSSLASRSLVEPAPHESLQTQGALVGLTPRRSPDDRNSSQHDHVGLTPRRSPDESRQPSGAHVGLTPRSAYGGPGGPDLPSLPTYSLKPQASSLSAALDEVVRRAEDRGVRLAFEPEPGMFVDTLVSAAPWLAAYPMGVFDLCIDIGHVHCQAEGDITELLRAYADRLAVVHLEDMKRGVHDHLMFGEGEIEFPPILRTLDEIGYAGGVYVELSRHSHQAVETARRSLAFLRAMAARR